MKIINLQAENIKRLRAVDEGAFNASPQQTFQVIG